MPGFSWMTKKSARIAYCGLFTGFVVLSLILSQVAAPLLQIFPWFLSKFGAGLFLLVQFVLLLDFTYTWNDACLKNDDTKWFYALFAISVGCYIASFTLSIFLFIWFNPSGHDCGLNVIFIVVNLILFVVFALIVLQVQGSLFPASAISVYFTYVCFTSLSSEPHDYVCNGLDNRAKGVSTSTIIIGLISTILCVLYSALRAGSTKALLSSLSYPRAVFAHLITFAHYWLLAAGATHLDAALAHGVYSDMLFSGWSSLSDCSEDTEAGEDIRDLKSWLVSLPYSVESLRF
ncbi:membrane protein TMS1-like [Chenopodium quinoa]|uniref:membrane protein TMS1-like n=1 Tax=Chenopodium quinoa TaxID=63459 RepID=UPI000B774160|nr:membrane protein TMS1-like [Chenopodium quinoa]